MKKLWNRFRDWLIRKLGGFTAEETWTAEKDWNGRMDAARDRIARLELMNNVTQKKNLELTRENGELKRALYQNPPGWITLKEEMYKQEIIRAQTKIHRYPEAAVDIVGLAKDRLAREILDKAQQAITYHFQNDFAGTSCVIAELRVLVGPGVPVG